MKTICTAVLVAALGATAPFVNSAETFIVKAPDGSAAGTIDIKDGAQIRIDGKLYSLSRQTTGENRLIEKMRSITLPSVDFPGISLPEVVTALQVLSVKHDKDGEGVNFAYKRREGTRQDPPVTLGARNISMLDLLDSLCNLSGLHYGVLDGVVVIAPQDVAVEPLVRKVLKENDLDLYGYSELKEPLSKLGVTWPEGSSVEVVYGMNRIVVVNTPANIELIEQIFKLMGQRYSQIEIEFQLVEFDLQDIDQLSRNEPIKAQSLLELRKNGKAKLLAAPKVVTKSGQQATVKDVIEVIYPTDFFMDYPSDTNTVSTSTNSAPLVPAGFQTRETGSITEVLPEMSTGGDLINMTFTTSLTSQPEWHTFNQSYTHESGTKMDTTVEQPFFSVNTVTTSIAVRKGATVLVSGGMPGKDPDKVVYCFVSAQLIDTEGKPLEDTDL